MHKYKPLPYPASYYSWKIAEKVVIETAENDILYWRDAAGVHQVPIAPFAEIILKIIHVSRLNDVIRGLEY